MIRQEKNELVLLHFAVVWRENEPAMSTGQIMAHASLDAIAFLVAVPLLNEHLKERK